MYPHLEQETCDLSLDVAFSLFVLTEVYCTSLVLCSLSLVLHSPPTPFVASVVRFALALPSAVTLLYYGCTAHQLSISLCN